MQSISQRESSFELLRLLAQFFIVLYHILYFFIYPSTGTEFFKAVWIPFHIGVPLFILISGYFGIRASIRGVLKYIYTIAVIYIPLQVLYILNNDCSFIEIIRTPFVISLTPFWFLRTYFFLYIMSPVINKFLDNIDIKGRVYLILTLTFISIYCGSFYFFGGDQSLVGGKHLVNFFLWYVVGNTLHEYRNNWIRYNCNYLFAIWLIINVVLVFVFSVLLPNRIANGVFELVLFSYSSVGLLINTILFFMIIGHIKINPKISTIINNMAKASLLIYIIHCSNYVFKSIIQPLSLFILDITSNVIIIFIYSLIISAVIVFSCCLIHYLLSPLWSQINTISIKHSQIIKNSTFYNRLNY